MANHGGLSGTLTDVSAWANSRVADGDIAGTVKSEQRDMIITGSLSVVHALMAGDLIDEYRLLTFPAILGTGERLFPAGGPQHTWSACRPSGPAPLSLPGAGGQHDEGPLPYPVRDPTSQPHRLTGLDRRGKRPSSPIHHPAVEGLASAVGRTRHRIPSRSCLRVAIGVLVPQRRA